MGPWQEMVECNKWMTFHVEIRYKVDVTIDAPAFITMPHCDCHLGLDQTLTHLGSLLNSFYSLLDIDCSNG